ncbi:MAG: hypothetical protein ABUT20_30480, partial [Bacteroidota bacterium]
MTDPSMRMFEKRILLNEILLTQYKQEAFDNRSKINKSISFFQPLLSITYNKKRSDSLSLL